MKYRITENNFRKVFCKDSGKEKNIYKTVKDAKNHLEFLQSENQVYYCDSCHGYHTSTKTSGNNVLKILEELKNKNNKPTH